MEISFQQKLWSEFIDFLYRFIIVISDDHYFYVVSSCEIVSKMFSRAEQNQHLYIFELHPTLHYCTDFFFFFCWKDFQNTNDFHRAEKTLIKTQNKNLHLNKISEGIYDWFEPIFFLSNSLVSRHN